MKLACKAIQERYSCRFFDNTKEVPQYMIKQFIYAASLAPSGKNLQPWKFKIVHSNGFSDILCKLLPNNKWVKGHKQFICAFLDTRLSYNIVKDCMSIAAAIENIIIEAKCNQIDSCWIGECTEYEQDICKYLEIDSIYQLLAIIAIGYSKRKIPIKNKNDMENIII